MLGTNCGPLREQQAAFTTESSFWPQLLHRILTSVVQIRMHNLPHEICRNSDNGSKIQLQIIDFVFIFTLELVKLKLRLYEEKRRRIKRKAELWADSSGL